MKKLYLVIILAGIGLWSFGQINTAKKELPKDVLMSKLGTDNSQSNIINNAPKASLDTIWYEDFSDSATVATTYTFVDNSGQNYNWVCTKDGPDGAYTNPSEIIHSTTYTNGYMLLNADGYNTEGGPTGTTMVANPIDMDAYFQTPAIDCSGKEFVVLKLQQKFRHCCGNVDIKVLVSNDGTNWTSFDAGHRVLSNTASSDPDIVEYNISQVAGNQSTVYIRYSVSTAEGSTQGVSHYYFCVDDIILYEANANDFRIEAAFPSAYFLKSAIYSQMPLLTLDCADGNGLIYAASTHNLGSTDEAPVLYAKARRLSDNSIEFDESGSNLYNLTSLAAGTTDTLYVDNTFYPMEIGNYRLIFDIEGSGTDATPENNVDSSMTLTVTDTVLAMHRTLVGSKGLGVFSYRSSSHIDGDALGGIIDLQCEDTVSSISFRPIRKTNYQSELNTSIVGQIWMWDGSAWTILEETQPYDFTAITQFNKWQTVSFDYDIVLDAGAYLFSVAAYGGKIYMDYDETTFQEDGSNFIYFMDEQKWYYETDAIWAVNLNFYRTPSGIADNKGNVNNISCYPNPFTGTTEISFELGEVSDVNLSVTDLTGKVIANYDLGRMPVGNHGYTLDGADFANGIYFYNLNVNGSTYNGKIVKVD